MSSKSRHSFFSAGKRFFCNRQPEITSVSEDFTISIAESAQSYPLFPPLLPALEIACSIFFSRDHTKILALRLQVQPVRFLWIPHCRHNHNASRVSTDHCSHTDHRIILSGCRHFRSCCRNLKCSRYPCCRYVSSSHGVPARSTAPPSSLLTIISLNLEANNLTFSFPFWCYYFSF